MLQTVMSRFSVENFLSYSTETFLRGTLRCCVSKFPKFPVAKKFIFEWGGGGGEEGRRGEVS